MLRTSKKTTIIYATSKGLKTIISVYCFVAAAQEEFDKHRISYVIYFSLLLKVQRTGLFVENQYIISIQVQCTVILFPFPCISYYSALHLFNKQNLILQILAVRCTCKYYAKAVLQILYIHHFKRSEINYKCNTALLRQAQGNLKCVLLFTVIIHFPALAYLAGITLI